LRLSRGTRPFTTTAAATTPTTPLLVRSRRPSGFGAGGLPRPLRARHYRHDSCQPARAAAPAGQLARPGVDLLDAFIEFGQPLFHGPLDLRTRRAWLLRPDARPFGANGFWRRIGVGRLGLDRDLRREFRHLQES
jgi:hypothetical protein